MSKWPLISLLNLVTDTTRGHYRVPKADYLPTGTTPVIDQSTTPIAGYTSLESTLTSPPYIIFGDHTRVIKYSDHPFAPGADGVKILKPRPEVHPRYIFHYLRTNPVPSLGYSRHFKELRRLEVPLPPLDEQRRIADILDVAARLKETFERKLNSSRRYFDFELSACIEATHSTKKFIKIASLTGGSTPAKGNPEYWTNGTIPWFSTKDLKSEILTDSVDHVTEKAIASTSLKKITNATVALSIRGMSLAHRVPMSIIPDGSTINQDLKVVDSDLPYSPNLWLAILTHKEQLLLSKVATSAHGTKRLEVSQILDLDIPIFEDAQLAKIERLAKLRAETLMSFDQILDNATELYNSLATRAFAGEL